MAGWKEFVEKLGRAYKAMSYHLDMVYCCRLLFCSGKKRSESLESNMKQLFLIIITFISVVLEPMAAQGAPANLTEFIRMLENKRPKATLWAELPKYPKMNTSCYKTQGLVKGFAREFKRECIDKNISNLKKVISSSLKATGQFPGEIEKDVDQCLDKIVNSSIEPIKTTRLVSDCYLTARGLKKKKDTAKKQIEKLSDLMSGGADLADAAWTGGMRELASCTFKALTTSGEMTDRDREFKKQEIDLFLSIPGKILSLPGSIVSSLNDPTILLLQFADTLAKEGLGNFQIKDYSSLEEMFLTLDRLNMSEMLAKASKDLLKKVSIGVQARRLALEEAGEKIVSLKNSCQVSRALSDFEIFRNMVNQEFLEQRWSINIAEKKTWCNAFFLNYDNLSDEWQQHFITDSQPDGWKYRDLKRKHGEHQELINTISRIYDDLLPGKIVSARKNEKQYRDLIERVITKTSSLVADQCIDEDMDSYLKEVEMTQERIEWVRNSKCGTFGLADEFQLEKFAKVLDDLQVLTKHQRKKRKETIDSVKNLASFCKPSEALQVLKNAKEEMDKGKLTRKRIVTDLAIAKGKQQPAPRMTQKPLKQREKGKGDRGLTKAPEGAVQTNLARYPTWENYQKQGKRLDASMDVIEQPVAERRNSLLMKRNKLHQQREKSDSGLTKAIEGSVQTNLGIYPTWKNYKKHEEIFRDPKKLSVDDIENWSTEDFEALKRERAESNVKVYDKCYTDIYSNLEKEIKSEQDNIEAFLKSIDVEIQPARRALEKCEGSSVFSDLRNVREQLTKKQCNSSPGISVRLREIDLLESALATENCTKLGGSACDVSPTTVPGIPGKYYKLSSFYGSDGAAHCFTSAGAKAKGSSGSITISLIGDGGACSSCPEGFMLKNDHDSGNETCVQCPEGMKYESGCCYPK